MKKKEVIAILDQNISIHNILEEEVVVFSNTDNPHTFVLSILKMVREEVNKLK